MRLRRRVAERKDVHAADLLRSEAAATLIQSIHRGGVARKRLQPPPSEEEVAAKANAKKQKEQSERKRVEDKKATLMRSKSRRGGKNAKSSAHRDLIEGRKKQVSDGGRV